MQALKTHRPRALFALCLATLTGSAPALALDATGTSFFDGFDRLDAARWYVSDGWANGDWQNCVWSKRAITLRDSTLALHFLPAKSDRRDYQCGEVQTTEAYGFGTYEARLKTGAGSGLNAAFFTYIGPTHGLPHDEIDFEVLTQDTGKVSVNTYVSGKPHNGAVVDMKAPTDAGFNTYSFTWEAERLRWYVNGALVHEATGSDLPENPQRIFFSLWGTDTLSDWMGPFAAPPGPVKMEVDWVAFTAAGEACAFPDSVLCVVE